MNDLTIMITAAGNQYMLGLVDCLKKNGERNIRLIGADMNNDLTILQMVDSYYQVPAAEDSSYIDRLLEVCRKENRKAKADLYGQNHSVNRTYPKPAYYKKGKLKSKFVMKMY